MTAEPTRIATRSVWIRAELLDLPADRDGDVRVVIRYAEQGRHNPIRYVAPKAVWEAGPDGRLVRAFDE
jgi:hypothetical protein